MKTVPFTFDVSIAESVLSEYDNLIVRNLSSMKGLYSNPAAYESMLASEDKEHYRVYEIHRPTIEGEILHGLSVLHPGKVGDEFFMTKGHFHSVLETGEVYFCLKGQGCMVMETPEGEWAVEFFKPNSVLYVPPRWAHRSVNTGTDSDLVTFFAYPGNAGHDYGTIESQGFRKLVVERGGKAEIVDNPRWKAPDQR